MAGIGGKALAGLRADRLRCDAIRRGVDPIGGVHRVAARARAVRRHLIDNLGNRLIEEELRCEVLSHRAIRVKGECARGCEGLDLNINRIDGR